jgi:hypothetical protein
MIRMMRGLRLRVLACALAVLFLPTSAAGQEAGVLRVKVVLAGDDGTPTPAPRYALLVSDDPPTAAPRRIITALDGTVVVNLRPGSYAVESDTPLAFRGRRYHWTQMVEITAGATRSSS